MPSFAAAAAAALIAVTPAVSGAAAAPAGSGLRFSGFATAGLAHSDVEAPWAFRRDAVQPPDRRRLQPTVDSRLGVQVNHAFGEQLEAVGQIVLKPQDHHAPFSQRVEWAFLAWRPAPDTMLRAGRINSDIFLMADHGNVGYVYPWVRPNTAFYGWLSFFSVNGADLSHGWSSGPARWRARAMVGQYDITATGLPQTKATFRARDVVGASLTREEGGLLIKASYMRQRAWIDGIDVGPVRDALGVIEATVPIPSVQIEARAWREALLPHRTRSDYAGLGLQYHSGPWRIDAEIGYADSDTDSIDAWNAYTSLGYRTGDVTWYGVLARALPRRGVVEPPAWPAPIAPLARLLADLGNFGRSDLAMQSLGARWDVAEQVAVKVQWDRIRTGRAGSWVWGHGTPDARRANVWSLVVDTVF